MENRRSVADWRKLYLEALRPTTASENIAREILISRSDADTASNNEQVIQNARYFEQGFFTDIVSMAEEYAGWQPGSLQAVYINSALNEYNYYAFTATDGYIVLGDDYFSRLFFFLSLVLLLDTQNQFNEEEQDMVRRFVHDFVYTDFLLRREFDYAGHPLTALLLKKEQETIDMANYLFYSIFGFILCHELSHHILGHTRGTAIKRAGPNGDSDIEIDQRSHEDELEADRYGCGLFLKIISTVDERYRHAFFKYRYTYTPVIVFTLFEHLDSWNMTAGRKISYDSHPPPAQRLEALQAAFDLDAVYPLCTDIGRSMKWLLQI